MRTQQLFENVHYVVSHVTGRYESLVVQRKRGKQGGIMMHANHPQFAGYLEGFTDPNEYPEVKNALARALLA